ncbi:MAG: hypothetical protein GY802_24145 [Gammaproteobacteria bacterium]|nr:hypothetical protein [Gammaproteobacteria bacterium]
MPEAGFESMLTGGHPNSLGRTLEVVELVLADAERLGALFDCYASTDEVVRLRTSNALKRIARERPEWLLPWLDRLLDQVAKIDQASAQWTLATLFQLLELGMNPRQKVRAIAIMQANLANSHDWIVLNTTMGTLANWGLKAPQLKTWLLPHLQRLATDKRGSVCRKAVKMTALLNEEAR